jgi:hypothetical protein
MAWFAGTRFQQVCDDEDNIPAMVQTYQQGQGFIGTDEYAPQGGDNSLVATHLPPACLVTDPDITLGQPTADDPQPEWQPTQATCDPFPAIAAGTDQHHRIRGMVSHAGYIILRLRRYPAWSVRVNNQPVANEGNRDDGLMVVPVPSGFTDITMDWTTTPDIKQGRWISLIALVAISALAAVNLRTRNN